ncbi:myelin expression factor 2 [Agrilus planipennis]|uniref:Myelin expression factor 2 n=1 Tax=Agrilus planipennis TaxID=224129 RepID=A0A1W4W7F8_AGRPL|nr:myelin expression factor 2 [Agrilus planipennis]
MSDRDDRSRSRDRSKRERPSRFSETSRERSSDRGRDRGGMKSSQCRVYVSNIPYEYRWQDLKDLFRSQVGDVAFVELFVDENDKPRGCGIVEFSDPNSVKKCLEVMHRFELKGRKLVIKEDFGNQRDKYGNLVGSAASKRAREREERDRFREDRRGGSGGFDLPPSQSGRGLPEVENKWGNTFGLSPQFLDSLGITSPIINRVFVANLDYKVDKKKLKEVFRLAGKVQKVDLSTDRDGNSRGFAVVEYDHPVEAVQAISMFHNQQLYDRVMTVRMDREGDRQSVKLPDGLKGIGMGLGVNGEPLRDVARNLPNANPNQQQSVGNTGAGLLGAVPNSSLPLGIGSALSGLNTGVASAALGSLGTNPSVLQAANLAGLSNNLLTGGVGAGDLGLAASLVNNPMVQNQSLAALAANTGSTSSFDRSGNSAPTNQSGQNYQNPSTLTQNFLSGGGAATRGATYNDKGTAGFGFGTSDRDTRVTPGNLFNGNQVLRNSNASLKNSGYSNKILISNLPPTAGLRMLSEKCAEFGEVQRIDDKGSGSVLVMYSSEWEAERAIKNMDRARIDGRTIDVRFFY